MATSKKKKQPELPIPEPTDWYSILLRDVAAASIQPPQTRDQIVEYYENNFPGSTRLKNGQQAPIWREKLIEDLQTIPINGKFLSRDSIARRFRARRGRDWRDIAPSAAAAAQYKALGDAIGVKAPPYGYHVHFQGWISFSHCEKRTFDVNLTDLFAKEIAQNHALIIEGMLLVYMEEDDPETSITEQSPSVGICMEGDETSTEGQKATDPDITITANQNQVTQGHGGRARRFSFFAR